LKRDTERRCSLVTVNIGFDSTCTHVRNNDL
jgi:hypothetical protein